MLSDAQKNLLFSLLSIGFLCYSLYLYGNLDAIPQNNQADYGKKLWQEKNCIACHQIYQLGGYLGPDLTNTYSLKGPEYIKAFIKNGTQIMPRFDLKDEETEAIIAYLKQIDSTGNSDPRTFRITKNGMIEQ